MLDEKTYDHGRPADWQQCAPDKCLDWPPGAVAPSNRMTFQPFQIPFNPYNIFDIGAYDVDFLYDGPLTKTEMLERLRGENSTLTWKCRLVGYCCMVMGLYLASSTIAYLLSSLCPLFEHAISEVLEGAVCLVSVLVCAPLTLGCIGVAWCAQGGK